MNRRSGQESKARADAVYLPIKDELLRMKDSGLTHKEICQELARRNITNSHGRPITPSYLSLVLKRLRLQDSNRLEPAVNTDIPFDVP